MLASLLSWGFSLVFGGLLVRALARRTELRMDYRAAAAGQPGQHAAGAGGDHRRIAVHRNHLPVAVERADRGADPGLAADRLVDRAGRRQRPHRRGFPRCRAGRAGTAAATHASWRMAGVQPAADRAALAAGVRLAVQRVRQQAGGHRHRQPQHLQLPVHLVGPAAALAAAHSRCTAASP
ncbi:hypothetical protein G6F60_013794 [Rhizopus arrhizus]|nr:hypothetical protein G6F60_013794 [Rhizopus arrhizus]